MDSRVTKLPRKQQLEILMDIQEGIKKGWFSKSDKRDFKDFLEAVSTEPETELSEPR